MLEALFRLPKFLEISGFGLLVFLFAVLIGVSGRVFGAPVGHGRGIRFFSGIFARWQENLDRRAGRTLLLAVAALGCFWSVLAILQHRVFETHTNDLGIFTNAIWNFVHGNGFVSAPKGGINLLSDHQSPVFWLWAPVFLLFPGPETLLIGQAFILTAGGAACHAIARQYLPRGHWGIGALPLLYWAYFPLHTALMYEFHPEVAMLPLFLAAIAGIQSLQPRSRILGGVAFVLALGCKETAGPVAVGVGLAWVFGAGPLSSRAFTRGFGILATLLGVGVFLADLIWVPAWFGSRHAYVDLYSHLGNGWAGVLLSPILNPAAFFGSWVDASRGKFLFWLLAPLGFLSLFFPAALLASLPGVGMLFLTSGAHRLNIHLHYMIEPVLGVFWAWPLAVLRVESGLGRVPSLRIHGKSLRFWTLVWALGLLGRVDYAMMDKLLEDPHRAWLRRELIPRVAEGLSLSATDPLLPHLATRPWVYRLTSLRTRSGELVACALHDSALFDVDMTAVQTERFLREAGLKGYKPEYQCRTLTVYRSGPVPCLVSLPECR